MSSAAIIQFKPRNHRRCRVAHVTPADLIVLAEHFSPRERADLHCRQASKILARTVALNMRAYFTLCDVGLSMFGFHDSHRGETQCANPAGKNPEDFREPA